MELDTKLKLKHYLESANITSVLNNTKWERLFKELQKIEFTLDFQRKDLDEAEPDSDYWDGDLYHVLGGWEQIEWLNISTYMDTQLNLLKNELDGQPL